MMILFKDEPAPHLCLGCQRPTPFEGSLRPECDAPPPEVQVEALEALVGNEPIGWMVLDRSGRAIRSGSNYAWFDGSRGVAETKAAEMNALTANHPSFDRQPFRAVPVGPIVDFKPFGWGAVDETGLAMNQPAYRSREALDGRVPDGFEIVQLFYAPPPDRPAEAVECEGGAT